MDDRRSVVKSGGGFCVCVQCFKGGTLPVGRGRSARVPFQLALSGALCYERNYQEKKERKDDSRSRPCRTSPS